MEEGVGLALESRRRVEEDEENHTWLKAEERASIVEEARLKLEEEELRLKSEDEARLVEETKLKSEQEEQARLKAEEVTCLSKTQGRKQRRVSMRN